MNLHAIKISDQSYRAAERIASIDKVSVETLIEVLIQRQCEMIDNFSNSDEMPVFSLDNYNMIRHEGESDDEYEARKCLFR